MVSVMVWVVVVVDCIDPWVNCGVTVCAIAAEGSISNRKSSFFIWVDPV